MISQPSGKISIQGWWLILIIIPIPLFLLGILSFRWHQEKNSLTRTTRYFLQRQNTILAYDAMEVAGGISDLLEKVVRDLRLITLLPPSLSNYLTFHNTQMSDYTQFFTETEPPKQIPLPFYNVEIRMDLNGNFLEFLRNGKKEETVRRLDQCQRRELCDQELFKELLPLPEGTVRYGKVLRYYTNEGKEEDEKNASLWVGLKEKKAIYVLGIDFKQIRDHLTTPAFPYEIKRNLLHSYQNGNYIYIIDHDFNIIAHPKYWHQLGIDRQTGEWVTPMRNDDEEGNHPLNIERYESGKLKEYFHRLLTKSFKENRAEVFRYSNLSDTLRVVSVAPIQLSKGQFEESGVFGHVILGCNVEYFEDNSEAPAPYY